MSIYGLFNKKISILRKVNVGTNEYGEQIHTEQLIASDVSCARQVGPGNNMRQFIDNKTFGPQNWKLVKYFLRPNANIKEADIIRRYVTEGSEILEVSEVGIVRDVRDAAGRGHHLEVHVEEVTPTGEPDKVNE